MRAFAALALLGAAAAAEVTAPLGRWARPGVPVLLTSAAPAVVEIDGWRWRVDGPTLVHPPRLPAVVRDEAGAELLRLEPVPEGTWLVGVAGDAPAELGELHAGVGVVGFDVTRVHQHHVPALDVFDRILLMRPGITGHLAEWRRAGGSIAAPFANPGEAGLGRWLHVPAIEDAVAPPMPPRLPRTGNVRPDLYDLVWPPEGSPAPRRAALWIVAGAAAAMALQVLLAAAGRVSARTLVAGVGAVAVLGSVLGLLRPRAEYEPVAEGRIEVVYRAGAARRVKAYRVFARAGPGASFVAPAGATPLLYREGSPPWWQGPDRVCRLEEGMVRIFEEEGGGGPGAEGEATQDRALDRVAARERPHGAWVVRLERAAAAPAPPPKGPVLLARITFVAQD